MATVITCVDSHPLAEECTYYLKQNSTKEINTIILLDNGSDTLLPIYDADLLIRFEENVGGNAVFHRMLPYLKENNIDIVAYFHTDVMIREQGWDEMVITAFESDPKLGIIGFLGSDEIDMAGGRGLGTMSSFMGYEYKTGFASKAEIHGKRALGLHPAAVLDHCTMIFRTSVLEQIPSAEEIHTPGHFYDRIVCLEVLNKGYHIAVFGIEFDHFSGGIGLCKARTDFENLEPGLINRDRLYKKWLTENNIPFNEDDIDQAMYVEGEKRYLGKWRDKLAYIPVKVEENYNITHINPHWKG